MEIVVKKVTEVTAKCPAVHDAETRGRGGIDKKTIQDVIREGGLDNKKQRHGKGGIKSKWKYNA